jgi:hypothetical protein
MFVAGSQQKTYESKKKKLDRISTPGKYVMCFDHQTDSL